MFAIAATNVVSPGRPVKLGRRSGPATRSVRVYSGGKKSKEIHEELKEKFTTAGECTAAESSAKERRADTTHPPPARRRPPLPPRFIREWPRSTRVRVTRTSPVQRVVSSVARNSPAPIEVLLFISSAPVSVPTQHTFHVPSPASRSPSHVAGGGYKGFCDYEEIKEAIKECDGLDGARLEACYAQFGCDIDEVTDHYAKAAGIKRGEAKK